MNSIRLFKKRLPHSERLALLYAKKLEKDLGDNGSDDKKNRKILKALRKYFQSRQARKHLKITLIALGVLGSIYYLEKHRVFEIVFNYIIHHIRSSVSDQNVDVNEAIEKSKTSNLNIKNWCQIGVVILLLGAAVSKVARQEDTKIDIEIEEKTITKFIANFIGHTDRKTMRKLIGAIMHFTGYAGLFVYPPVALPLYILGWQILTHP